MDTTEVIRQRRCMLYEKTSKVEKFGRQNFYNSLDAKVKLHLKYAEYLEYSIQLKEKLLAAKEMEVKKWKNVIEWCQENPLGVTVDPVKQVRRNIQPIKQEITKLKNKLDNLRKLKADTDTAIKEVKMRMANVLEKHNISCSDFVAMEILSDGNAQLMTEKGHEAPHGTRKRDHERHATVREGSYAQPSTGKDPAQDTQHPMLVLGQGTLSSSIQCHQDPRLKLPHWMKSPVPKRSKLDPSTPQAMEKPQDAGNHLPLKNILPLLEVRPLQEIKLQQPQHQKKNLPVEEDTPVIQKSKGNSDVGISDSAEELNAHSSPEQEQQNENLFGEDVILSDSEDIKLSDTAEELKAQSPVKSPKRSQPDEEDDDVQFVEYIVRDNSVRLSQ